MKVTDFFDLLWESFGLAAMDDTSKPEETTEGWNSVAVTAGSTGGGLTAGTGFERSIWAVVTTGLTSELQRRISVMEKLEHWKQYALK